MQADPLSSFLFSPVSSGSLGAAAEKGPVLPPNATGTDYAVWRPLMETFLIKLGLTEKDYAQEIKQWNNVRECVRRWETESEEEAMRFALLQPSSASASALSDSSSASGKSTAELPAAQEVKVEKPNIKGQEEKEREQEMKKVIRLKVARSHRAYVTLYAAVPLEQRPQVDSLVKEKGWQGYAFAVWDFLEKKYQNTERDNIVDVWMKYTALEQQVNETWASYKARVDLLRSLLTGANEPDSKALYWGILMVKLQPLHRTWAAALGLNERFTNVKSVPWEEVLAYFNQQENNMRRLDLNDANEDQQRAMAAGAYGMKQGVGRGGGRAWNQHRKTFGNVSQPPRSSSGASGGSTMDKTIYAKRKTEGLCFGCGGKGHMAMHCPNNTAATVSTATVAPNRWSNSATGPVSQPAAGGTASASTSSNGQTVMKHQAKAATLTDTSNKSYSNVAKEEYETDARGTDPDPVSDSMQRHMAMMATATGPASSCNSSTINPNHPAAEGVSRQATDWGVDTMASVHVTGNRALLIGLRRRRNSIRVQTADINAGVTAQYEGSVLLRVINQHTGKPIVIKIDNVLYHESFASNLLGWAMLKEQGWRLQSDNTYGSFIEHPQQDIRIQCSEAGRVMMINSSLQRMTSVKNTSLIDPVENENLAFGLLDENPVRGLPLDELALHGKDRRVHWAADKALMQEATPWSRQLRGEVVCATAGDLWRLHQRLGHIGYEQMMELLRKQKTQDLGRLTAPADEIARARIAILQCIACKMAKGHRTPVGHRGLDRGTYVGEVLHLDTFHVRLTDGSVQWGIDVKETYGDAIFFDHVDRKSEVMNKVVVIIKCLETQTGKLVRRVYTDQGSEFPKEQLQQFFDNKGIIWHRTPTDEKEMNGIAERLVRTLKEVIRVMLIAGPTPVKYWWYAGRHFQAVWNRTHIGERTGMTPDELIKGRAPSARYFGVFGCDAYVHVRKQLRTHTFAPVMEPAVYLGHDYVHNCSTVVMLRTMSIVYSRNIDLRESSFVHSRCLDRIEARDPEGERMRQRILTREYTAAPVDEWGDAAENHPPARDGSAGSTLRRSQVGLNPDPTAAESDIFTMAPDDGKPQLEGSDASIELQLDAFTSPAQGGMEILEDVDISSSSVAGSSSKPIAKPKPIAALKSKEWAVRAILGQKRYGNGYRYLVDWEDGEDGTRYAPSWEPGRNLKNAQERIEAWRKNFQVDTKADVSAAAVAPGDRPGPASEPSEALRLQPESSHASNQRLPAPCDDQGPRPADSELQLHMHEPPDSTVHPAMRAAVHCFAQDDAANSSHYTERWRRGGLVTPALAMALQQAVQLTSQRKTPDTYKEAMAGPDAAQWKASMDAEMASCEEKGTWMRMNRKDLPPGANVLPCKWVYKIKLGEHGEEVQFKSRITPKGFRQKYGVDYEEVFASTGMYKTLRVFIAICTRKRMVMIQMDVPSAFLNAGLEEDVYMEVPEGYKTAGEDLVMKLLKALYGLKQAPRNWQRLLIEFLTSAELGFAQCKSDENLYWKRNARGNLMLLFVFVDDMRAGFHEEDEQEFTTQVLQKLVSKFQIKLMGEAKMMLGMRILRDKQRGVTTMDQELYITRALERFGMTECKTAETPAIPENRRSASAAEAAAMNEPCNHSRYMEMVGTLLYAAISTRPDISYAVGRLTRHMQAPKQQHMVAAERVFRYLAGTKNIGLIFGREQQQKTNHSEIFDVSAHSDADHGGDLDDRKSTTGWIARVGGDVVSWASKKQRVVAISSCEAELYAAATATCEVLWQRGLLTELQLCAPEPQPSILHIDNQSTEIIARNGIKGERTKHIDIRWCFFTDEIHEGRISPKWIPTKDQHADILTKALPAPQFLALRKQIMTE